MFSDYDYKCIQMYLPTLLKKSVTSLDKSSLHTLYEDLEYLKSNLLQYHIKEGAKTEVKLLARIIQSLQNSYRCAIENKLTESNYHHAIALITHETLEILMPSFYQTVPVIA